jgi:hypothetical protein
MIVDEFTGIGEFLNNLSITLAPNPNDGSFALSVSATIEQVIDIRVFNITGRVVFEETSVSTNASCSVDTDLTNQPEGMYFVHILTDGNRYAEKVVIR